MTMDSEARRAEQRWLRQQRQYASAREIIRRIVEEEPLITQRAALRKYRRLGNKISNDIGRIIVDDARNIQMGSGAERFSGAGIPDSEQVRRRKNPSRFIRLSLLASPVFRLAAPFFLFGGGGDDDRKETPTRRRRRRRVREFRYVKVQWRVSGSVSVSIEGRHYRNINITGRRGSYIATISQTRSRLVADRIEQMVEGIVTEEVTTAIGGMGVSFAVGIDIDMSKIRMEVTRMEGR